MRTEEGISGVGPANKMTIFGIVDDSASAINMIVQVMDCANTH